jgi:hypothetical protein
MAALARELKAQGKDIISCLGNLTLTHQISLKKQLKKQSMKITVPILQ